MKKEIVLKVHIYLGSYVYLWIDSQVIHLIKIINDAILLNNSYIQEFTTYVYGDKWNWNCCNCDRWKIS